MMQYLLYSTLLSLFSQAFTIHAFVDLKLFYIVVLVNLSIIWFSRPIRLNRYHLWGMIVVFSIGAINSIGHFSGYIMQVFGISIVSIYYYVFFRNIGCTAKQLFEIYCQIAFWVSVIGLVMVVYNYLSYGVYTRLESVMNEPAHFSALVLPAWYYILKKGVYTNSRFIVLSLAIILSGSSVGFLGVLLGVILASNFNVFRMIASLVIGVAVAVSMYAISDDFKLRVDDSAYVVTTMDLSGVNLSTYALFSNGYVAYRSFLDNPIFGSGLGSHKESRGKYLENMDGIEAFEQYYSLNEKDANSLFLRVLSELGLLGLVIVAFFIFRHGRGLTGESKNISRGILIYFFTKLLREGHYFSPEMYFFVMCYYFIHKQRLMSSQVGGAIILRKPWAII